MQRWHCVWLVALALSGSPAVASACDGSATGCEVGGFVVAPQVVYGPSAVVWSDAYAGPQALGFAPAAAPLVLAVPSFYGFAVAPVAVAPLVESCTEVRVLRQRFVRRPVRVRQRIVTRSVLR